SSAFSITSTNSPLSPRPVCVFSATVDDSGGNSPAANRRDAHRIGPSSLSMAAVRPRHRSSRQEIYWFGRSGQVDCLDARNGKVIWETHLDKKYEIGVLSCRGSPLIEGNLLILFAGGKPGACVMALDKQTGKEVWKALNEALSNSSPLIIVAGGTRQLIV